ncbi:MAG TPA: UpxY family transcription antiterminator [Candidatus Latescibacteria bacterium]|nr:UpxY family transcription antiterminator [Candidatus Latescibacterota bacterium]
MDTPCWYALYTRARHEKKVDFLLKSKGIESYLPLQRVLRRWSDRKKWVEEPLFRCYVFVRVLPQDRLLALQTPGVVKMVCFGGEPAVIPHEQIEAVRRVLEETRNFEPCAYFTVGDRVEVMKGPLAGLEGILVRKKKGYRLVIVIDSIRQALSVEVDAGEVRRL